LLLDRFIVSFGGSSLFSLRLSSVVSFVFLSFCFVFRGFFYSQIKDPLPFGFLSLGKF
jgi:hypothetical protein